jgi:hypothetical protein
MPAAEAPSSESPEAEPGRSTKTVGGVRRSDTSGRLAIAVLVLTLLGGVLILGGCSAAPSVICARNPQTLTPVTGSTLTTLPPSHDNDVGRARLPDLHPDADVDASQIPKAGRCQKS